MKESLINHLLVTLKRTTLLSNPTSPLRRPTDIRKHRPNRRQLRGSATVVHFCPAAPNRRQPFVARLGGSRVHLAYRKHGRASGLLALCDNWSEFGVLCFFVAA